MDGRHRRHPQGARRQGLSTPRSCPTPPSTPSAFTIAFRDAIGSSGAKGDKKTYQMDPANSDEAARGRLRHRGRCRHGDGQSPACPIISTSYAAKGCRRADLRLPGERRVRDDTGRLRPRLARLEQGADETLGGFKRAGCDGILTYGAVDAARLLATRHRSIVPGMIEPRSP